MLDYTIQLRLDYTIQVRLDQTRLDQTTLYRLDQIRLDYTIQLRLDQTRLHYIAQTRLHYIAQTRLHSFQQSMLTFQEVYAHILGTYLGVSSHFTSSQPHFSNLCSHLGSVRKSVLTFQEHMLVSHLILPPLSLILAIYAHILGTYLGVSSHFSLIFSNLCSHFRKSLLTFQEDMLVSHLILPPLSLILAIYAHIWVLLGSLCSHFRKICWSLISFYLLLASFQQSMLTFGFCQEVCAHILGRYVGLSSHFTSSQPHFSNLCSHFRNICWSLISFQPHFQQSMLTFGFCQEVCAHILGTYLGLSSHFTSSQPHFSNLCSHLGSVRKSVLTFQEHILVSHLILPPLSLILAIYAHIWVLLGSLCSHFRNICWSLISFYLLLASFQQSMLTFQEVCAHILGTYVDLSSHFTSSQPHFSNLCSHFRNICWSLISFQPHFSNLCSHLGSVSKSVLTFQEHMLVSHLILPPLSLILAIYDHIWVLLGSLCSHFRNICWSLISFYLLLASFQQSMLTFQEHMLVSHLILASFQQSMLTFQEHMLVSHLILASFQQSMLTFQEHMLVSHLILPPVSLILAIYAHILPWRQAFQPISFTFQLDFIFAFFFAELVVFPT